MPDPDEKPAAAGGSVEQDRRAKLRRLREELGVDPYGGRVDGLIPLAEARARYDTAADEAHKAAPTPTPAPGSGGDAASGGGGEPTSGGGGDRRPVVRIAGRIVLHRDIGKLVFMTLRDATGDLQVAASKKSLGDRSFRLAKLADLGDVVVAEGPLGTTKTGEVTVWAAGEGGLALGCKSLAPPPEKWRGLRDPELRYRRRYVDLYANPEVMRTMRLRIRIVDEIRRYLRGRGYMEVETPMLQPIAGGAAARPFKTHHNALDIDLYLRIAPELYLKRLLVGGFDRVFEINRNFRNEGVSPRHNPEFTMLEAYEAFGSWETMADLVEDMICTVAQNVLGTLKIEHRDADGNVTRTINLERPWRRVSMTDLVAEWTQRELGTAVVFNKNKNFDSDVIELLSRAYADSTTINARENVAAILTKEFGTADLSDLDNHPDIHRFIRRKHEEGMFVAKLHKTMRTFFINRMDEITPAEQLVEVYEGLIEPTLIDPTFVTRVPSVVIPLARENREDPFFADVYELAINGVEISPGYTELNDPEVQERHFRGQVGDPRNPDQRQPIDEDFIEALRVGMPPAGGMGLGVDRLAMALLGVQSIRDVILFPLLRPEGPKQRNDE